VPRGGRAAHPLQGLDDGDGSLIAPGAGQDDRPLGFLLADARGAREDFQAMLAQLAADVGDRPPAFGLYFNCAARGRDLYGADDVDVAAIRARFPGLPIAGLFGSFELCPAPVGPGEAENRLHAYTGVLALFG
jgi:small ligand-binding sensory domain FIST